MSENQNAQPLGDFLTERELLDLLGIKKATLDHIRYTESLPYCKVNTRCRLYHEPDIRAWLLSRKTASQNNTE